MRDPGWYRSCRPRPRAAARGAAYQPLPSGVGLLEYSVAGQAARREPQLPRV